MKPRLPNNLILNGFDRCGSSAIARTLCQHADIELIFQPFNSGPIRHKMYQIMNDDIATDCDRRFFAALENGRLETDYIVSEWHQKYSSVFDFQPHKLHVIKTTLNHFTIEWVQARFPRLEQWGIWRNPLAILASIQRNRFFERWYADALSQITPTVKGRELLADRFSGFLDQIENSCQTTAFLIAVRSYFYLSHLDPQKLLIYENFKDDANSELNRVSEYFGLPSFDFRQFSAQDWNVSGERYDTNGEHSGRLLQARDQDFAERVFQPLWQLYALKFERREKPQQVG